MLVYAHKGDDKSALEEIARRLRSSAYLDEADSGKAARFSLRGLQCKDALGEKQECGCLEERVIGEEA